METQLNSKEMKEFFDSEAFKQIERRIVQDAVSEANETTRKELELFKFEMLYPNIVSAKEREDIEIEVTKTRNEKWEKALKQANGDEEKALMMV